jgi:hypothetical protein
MAIVILGPKISSDNFGLSVISAITVASVYGYMQKPMKSMWSPGKNPTHTIHVEDVAGGAWACANWVANHGRKEADQLAGVPIIFHNDKTKVKEVEGMLPHDENPVAPIFNLVILLLLFSFFHFSS